MHEKQKYAQQEPWPTLAAFILIDNGHPTLTVNSYMIYNVYETHRAYTCTCSTLI